MKNGFSPRIEITNSEKLFGRNDLFNQLLTLANNRYSVSIIGLRRFGKTSMLKCIETSLRQNTESKAYPIFFDFKEVGSIIKGTDNVYKYMISSLVARLFKDSHFREEAVFKKITIKAAGDWEDVFESLKDVNTVRIQGLFEEIVVFFSEYLEKTILFLIDEYEWLFRFSFDQPVGFMKLRNFSSKLLQNGISPFSFWIAGATPWDYLCTITGSGELNVIDAPPIYLGPIDYEAFQSMWQDEISKIENCAEQIKNSGEFAYQASGGVPFYGKLIGSHMASTKTQSTYTILKSYFQELVDSLQNEEKSTLIGIARTSMNFKNSKYIHELLYKGLIKKNGNIYEIKIGFLKEFLNASFEIVNNASNRAMPESQKLTDSITSLIMNINKTNKNKNGSYIFEPVVDEAALIKDLRTPCYSIELFSDFASSLFKIVFEQTKESINGKDVVLKRLPKPYKRGHKFIDIVDILRHSLGSGHLMDTFTPRLGQLTKPQMLQILVGTKNEPNTAEEFYSLQIATLKMFEKELNNLNSIVRSLN
jgi:hypothetical protein